MMSHDMISIGLLISYQCNLDCSYCYIPNKLDKKMSFSMAKKILEPILNAEGVPVNIIFIGAEPLVAFPILKNIVEWAESEKRCRGYCFAGTTNGTLLNDEIKTWLRLHKKCITFALSYDGLEEAHNQNRSKSYNKIDADFFRQTWPLQKIQMTINESTVNDMARGVISFTERGFLLNANVAYEEKEWSDTSIKNYAFQLEHLIEYYLSRKSVPHIYQFTHPLLAYSDNIDNPKPQFSQCGAGNGYCVYDIDGKIYPCHIISPLVFSTTHLANSNSMITDSTCFADDDCRGCPYISDCPTCMGCNLRYRGALNIRDKTHCKITKLEVMASMKYHTKRMLRKKKLSYKDVRIINAINKLMNSKYSDIDFIKN